LPLHAPPRMGRGGVRFAFACASTSQEPSRSSSEHSPPPRSLFWLLIPSSSRPGLCPLRLLLDRLGGFSRLPESVEPLAQIVPSTLSFLSPPALLGKLLPQRGLRLLGEFQADP